MNITTRQLQDKYQKQNVDLYMTFVDHAKAFDQVSRDWVWKIMTKFGRPPKFKTMVRQLNDGMLAKAQNDGEFPNRF